jgi:DNA polymerase I-like protein with 3'-5' exonuclease and polymerase domains
MRILDLPDTVRILTVESDADLLDFAWWLEQRRGHVLGIDCENNGRDQFSPRYRLRVVQVSDGFESWVIDVSRVSLRNLATLIVRHPLFVAHYSEADIRFLVRGLPGSVRVTDYAVPHIVDTQVVLAWFDPRTVTSQDDAYDPRLPLPRGLKPTVERLCPGQLLTEAEEAMHAEFARLAPAGMRKKEDVLRNGFATIPFADDRYVVYAGLDPLYTVRLYRLMLTAIRARGQLTGLTDDLRLQWVCDLMTLRGIGVDGPYAGWLDGQLQSVVDDLTPGLAHFGISPSGMGFQVGQAFERLNVVSPKSSRKTGAPSWDKAVLAELTKETGVVGDLASAVTTVRKANKFRATYVAPMLDSLEGDGRVHCSFRACGTITSRNSAMRPPVQQLPKKDTRVRAAIRAADGYVLVGCDLSQGEPRTMAALSGDRNLLADILAGDLNSAIATAAFGDAYDPAFGQDAGTVHYLMRNGSKAGFLAWCYGAGDNKVADTIGIDRSRGPEVTAGWRARYPDLARYQALVNAGRHVVLENGWVAPLWDRVFMTEDGQIRDKGKPSRKGLNYATQGNQRQLLARAVHKLVAWGWGWALAMLVHDEILLEVPAWMAQQAKATLENAMTSVFHGVPIDCHADVLGTTWAQQPDEFDLRELDAVAL